MAKEKKIIPGSTEDLKLINQTMTKFWANKIKAIDLYNKKGMIADGTANTQSVCHQDGTDDPN